MNQLCKVCGEPAAGFHFGAFTCEGCKSFFGRTYNNAESISDCKNSGKCVINKKNRTSCKACRLNKCILVGMSKSGSRYGRRSNWFKIHCLLQEDGAQGKISSSDTSALLGGRSLFTSPPTSSAPYDFIRNQRLPIKRHCSPALEERTSSTSPGDSSSETDSKIMTANHYHHTIYGGMETPSPPYDRREVAPPAVTHHLPMSPVSPISPNTQFVYHGSSNGGYNTNGISIHAVKHRESPRHFLHNFIPKIQTHNCYSDIKFRMSSPEPYPPVRLIKKEASDDNLDDQEKPIDLSLGSNNASPIDRDSSSGELSDSRSDSPQSGIADIPLDLTRKA